MDAVTNLQNAVQGYAQALAADALSPQPSYSIDNQSASRDQWRKSLIDAINTLNMTINAMQPYILVTRQVL